MFSVDGRLTATRPASVGSVLELADGYVVPPFAEGHNHWLEPAVIDAYVAAYLRDGVFYLKDQANASVVRRRLDAALNRPTAVDFISANEGWTGPGGHPMQIALQFLKFGSFPAGWTEADLDRNVVNEVASVADVDSRWPGFLAGRPDFVKLFLLYSEEYAKRRSDPQYGFQRGIDPTLVPEIARRAHAAGLRVSAHVYSAADFHNAIAGGVDDVAHMPGTGYDERLGVAAFLVSEADARLAASRGVTVMTTLSWLGEQMDENPAQARQVLESVIRPNVAMLRRFGVPILIGSDQFRQSSAPEARLLARLGLFTNAELLTMWCETTPRAIFPGRRIGRLDEGFEASLLVLARNPLDDFAATGEIATRMKQGVVLPPPSPVPFPELPGS
jgi:predicted amidohydrolase YtcJ